MISWTTPSWQLVLFPFFLLGFFGLGNLALRVFHVPVSGAAKGFLAGVLGLCVSQTLALVGLPLWVSIGVTFLGLVGLRFGKLDTRAVGLAVLSTFTVLMIVGEDLIGWDGRAIWFFHGRMIYEAQSVLTPNWTDPAIASSHPDYPKLVAILSAQIATILGGWHERWPKLALLVLLALAQMGFNALSASNRRVWVLNAVLILGIGYLLWNGSMDGYLALFTFLAAAFLSAFLASKRDELLWCGLGSLGLLGQLKNEGLVISGILAGTFFWQREGRQAVRSVASHPLFWLLLMPTLGWSLIRHGYSIENDLTREFSWHVPLQRLVTAEFWQTMGSVWVKKAPLGIVFLLAVGWKYLRRDPATAQPSFRFAFFSALAYLGVIFAVYLCTYWNLLDHLRSSLWRVVLPLYSLLLISVLCLSWVPKSDRPLIQRQG